MTPPILSLTHLAQPPRQWVSGKPPLLLLLHGVGSHEQDLFGLAPSLDPRFFIVSARAPVMLGPGAYGWYRVQWTDAGPQHVPAEAEAGRVAASRFIAEAVAAYGLDAGRVYVMGFSQGAITALSLALTEPRKTAGAVVMSGRLLPEVAAHIHSQALADYPFFVAHGTQDTVLPLEYGREIRDALSALPVDLTYREYAMAHGISPQSLDDSSAWLSARLDTPK